MTYHSTNINPKRSVRSFVCREGRITQGQRRALTELWPQYGIETGVEPLDLKTVFGRDVPVIMEIGFGDGGALVEMAANQPECNFLGLEVYRPGVGRLLLRLSQHGLTNVRVIMQDAYEVLLDRVDTDALAKVLVFFPDPWPKKRHHKRRLINPGFVNTLVKRIRKGGHLHVATDWEDYASYILEIMQNVEMLENTGNKHGFSPRPSYRPQTKYERRGNSLGHEVRDMIFRRV